MSLAANPFVFFVDQPGIVKYVDKLVVCAVDISNRNDALNALESVLRKSKCNGQEDCEECLKKTA